eukprot:scaffold185804_cov45-Prasinocladus_malaysianus.AAC.2
MVWRLRALLWVASSYLQGHDPFVHSNRFPGVVAEPLSPGYMHARVPHPMRVGPQSVPPLTRQGLNLRTKFFPWKGYVPKPSPE